jgi:hypothetical protein
MSAQQSLVTLESELLNKWRLAANPSLETHDQSSLHLNLVAYSEEKRMALSLMKGFGPY